MGQFLKDDKSKEIILNNDPETGKTVDMRGRLVNATGYLIDEAGNIVKYDTEGKRKIMFNFWEILYQEPPKIFKFTEFNIQWIKGRLDRDVTQNPKHDDEFDLDGRLINSLGYLIDVNGNIVDQHDKVVFRREILSNAYGQDARIPAVFTKKDLLLKPIGIEEAVSSERDAIVHGSTHHQQVQQVKKSTKAGSKAGSTTGGNLTQNMSGAGPNDTTNIGSAGGMMEPSKSGNQSGVFDDSGAPHASQMSNATAKNKGQESRNHSPPDNQSKMQIEELQSDDNRQFNINIGGKSVGRGNEKKPNAPFATADGSTSQHKTTEQGTTGRPKKKQKKKKEKPTPGKQQRDVTPQRPGDKIVQNLYRNFVDSPNTPDDQAEPVMMQPGRKPPRVRSKDKSAGRPIRSAVRN